MVEKKVVVKLKKGLQARPAALFVQEASRFTSEIYIKKDERKVSAKSIMGIMSLAIANGTELILEADGNDEIDALESLAKFISEE